MNADQNLKETAVRYLRQWEVRDYTTMRGMCTDTATVWHNDGGEIQTIDENMEVLKNLAGDVETLRYDIVRQMQEGNEIIQQQVLHLTNNDGSRSDVLAAMYFRFEGDLIDRIEEYYTVVPLA
ncbi:nuclear transport factor 2 family protein [Streptomyces tsukubensis]|uniref:SnoaL-like domain-containing protein n=1 Tax=Streptomyces tsukubensis TaxID=83656 RepID=A0A1V4A8Y4_9ACTN|nr:nuclear transport factor 2 family protein [Streptomyces tsukubensis]OON78738.1 hypothetical protein B1H18_15210 [Streptomyces tsukubensis]QFR94209.1 nuclear transport factor 2 family protein [Streptomyces tsukubensis]